MLLKHKVRLAGRMGTAFYFENDYDGFDLDAFSPPLAHTDMVEISPEPEATSTYTLTFEPAVRDIVMHIGSLGSVIAFEPGAQVRPVSGSSGFHVEGSVVTGKAIAAV